MNLALPKLNLPQYQLDIISQDGIYLILDPLRHKYVALTQEEWVRQNMIPYIAQTLQVSYSFMASETTIKVNNLTRRCDLLIYNRKGEPLVLVEFKRPDIAITQHVFDQAAGYNLQLNVPYLIVSNGLMHIFSKADLENKKYIFYENWPLYNDLNL